MILTALPRSVLYRALTPRWAYQPISGAGAAKQGGRFNRPGTNALYLAFSADTAMREYQQTSELLPPLTLASYHVELQRIVDFRAAYNPEQWDPLWHDWDCEWRALRMLDGVEPPSWVLADWVEAAGASGLAFPSSIDPWGLNLVVYTDRLAEGDSLAVHDPDGALPRSQASW